MAKTKKRKPRQGVRDRAIAARDLLQDSQAAAKRAKPFRGKRAKARLTDSGNVSFTTADAAANGNVLLSPEDLDGLLLWWTTGHPGDPLPEPEPISRAAVCMDCGSEIEGQRHRVDITPEPAACDRCYYREKRRAHNLTNRLQELLEIVQKHRPPAPPTGRLARWLGRWAFDALAGWVELSEAVRRRIEPCLAGRLKWDREAQEYVQVEDGETET